MLEVEVVDVDSETKFVDKYIVVGVVVWVVGVVDVTDDLVIR